MNEISHYKKKILDMLNVCINFESERITTEKEKIMVFNQILKENEYLRKIFLNNDLNLESKVDLDMKRILNTKYESRRNYTEVNCVNRSSQSDSKVNLNYDIHPTQDMEYGKNLDQLSDKIKRINSFEKYGFIEDRNQECFSIDLLEKKYSLDNFKILKKDSAKSIEKETQNLKNSLTEDNL